MKMREVDEEFFGVIKIEISAILGGIHSFLFSSWGHTIAFLLDWQWPCASQHYRLEGENLLRQPPRLHPISMS